MAQRSEVRKSSARRNGGRRPWWRVDLQNAGAGRGLLIRRDYWAVIRNARYAPSEIATLIRHQFEDFPPPSLCVFKRNTPGNQALDLGDQLEVRIRMAGSFAVCVTHVSEQSITLGTMKGHPEAGRITFGAYRNGRGDVIFHIRSIARSSSWRTFTEFLMAGDPMQTYTWTDFVDSVAHTVGDGVIGAIQAEMHTIDGSEQDELMELPTYVARGN